MLAFAAASRQSGRVPHGRSSLPLPIRGKAVSVSHGSPATPQGRPMPSPPSSVEGSPSLSHGRPSSFQFTLCGGPLKGHGRYPSGGRRSPRGISLGVGTQALSVVFNLEFITNYDYNYILSCDCSLTLGVTRVLVCTRILCITNTLLHTSTHRLNLGWTLSSRT